MTGSFIACYLPHGQLVRIDIATGKYDVIAQLKGFVRGMAKRGDYLFIGLSKLRQNASTFRDLAITKDAIYCGVEIIHLPTGRQCWQYPLPAKRGRDI